MGTDGDEAQRIAARFLDHFDERVAALTPEEAVEACVLCLAGLEDRLQAHNRALGDRTIDLGEAPSFRSG